MIYDKEKIFNQISELLAAIPSDRLTDILYRRVDIEEWESIETGRPHLEEGDNSVLSGEASGYTKIVLFPKEEKDIVIKIPYRGMDLYQYDESDGGFGFVKRKDFEGISSWDYCDKEASLYKQARRCGVERFFACTEYVGDALGKIPIYAAERCGEYKEDNVCRPPKVEGLVKLNIPPDVAGVLSAQYKTADLHALVRFLRRFHVNDLHERNWGVGRDGNLKIIDYAGYEDGFSV